MKTCFGYVRVSTVKQGQGVSLDAQRAAIEQFAHRSGIVIGQWFEEKETAAKQGRPVFDAMLKALRRGKAAGVVMHKIDRSARNFRDWATIGELADAGVDIHFATESLDFRSRGGRLSADIQAVIAADYIRNLREETIKGLTGRLKQGLYPFMAPLGYLDNGGGKPKTIDPVRGPLVQRTFELYASGQHSLRTLAPELERIGLRSRQGRALTKGHIEKILHNPFYCGIIRIKKSGETYPGVHEPLISVRLFEDVQAVREGRAIKKVTRHHHLYRGLFSCQRCAKTITAERQKGHVYYRCHSHECRGACVREERITSEIGSVLSRLQLSEEDIAKAEDRMIAWWRKRQKGVDTTALRLQLAACEQKLERLTDAAIDRIVDREEFARRKEALLIERARIEEAIVETSTRGNDASYLARFFELMKSLQTLYISANPSEKRQIAQMGFSNRWVSGKSVLVEPRNWLKSVHDTLGVYCGPPGRTTSRRRPQMSEAQATELTEIMRSEEVSDFLALFGEHSGKRASTERVDK